MDDHQQPKDLAPIFNDERMAAWMDEHLLELEQSASGQRILYSSLAISFVVGLAAHVGGYILLSTAPRGLLGLLADLLHALGWSLWTGAVVAVFVQILPEAKRRQIKHLVDAYEVVRRGKAGEGGEAADASPSGRAGHEPKPKPSRKRTQRGG